MVFLAAADGINYTVSDWGTLYVIRRGEKFEILSEQRLKDICMVRQAFTKVGIYLEHKMG